MSNQEEQDHNCKENWYDDADVFFRKINNEQWSWVLDETWEATKFDVEDGAAEQEGQTLGSHTLLISYCPFCGCHLTDLRGKYGDTHDLNIRALLWHLTLTPKFIEC